MKDLPFTLDQLKILKAIVSEGSFKSAAETLYISQPAVSLHIQNIERQLNVSLFDRGGRQTKLTKAGSLILSYGSKILSLCEETCRAVEDLRNLHTGTLVIGASQTLGTYLMPRLIGIFRQRYPQVSLQLQVHSTRKIAWSIANGQIDLALVGGEVPDELKSTLEVYSYGEDELALILPKSHPFVKMDTINKEDLYRLRFISLDSQSTIRKVIDKTLEKHYIDTSKFKIEMELNSIEAIKNAVQSGLGASFVSSSAIAKELELGILHWAKIENITIKRNLSILINPFRYKSKATEIFLKEMLALFNNKISSRYNK
ncbi:[pt] transcription factor [Galdieria sulphuraria]|uniref:Probable RuBisCO transcriptional regulator n=1 Tax=Galdieria sulphuraria TaxID=130081 RepID=M2XYC3_GALSU|nr:LysR transcriptional regulator [Galdieria sulphuraria]XP_005704974.1 [pt] transcription factor [Galdieria sulphuraria]AIG92614.1 LysR transcriptional regulator [Galdieria sulphuraria]EME28454.1 [pt] transcription factor [Galdieria sulphuraria]|eukprot:XP_005704974.1 [pt] transcription factor [Galdieria sulphuraria]